MKDFEGEFEAKKRQISCNTTLDDIRLQIPNKLNMFATKKLKNLPNKPITEQIYIDKTQFQNIFKFAKVEIICFIEKVIAEVESIEFILSVEGFSCSSFLRDEIKGRPAFSTIKVISPPKPGTVVLKGAVLFG